LPRGTRDDPRDEEDVGTDLDFSKYTRDRIDYESGGNIARFMGRHLSAAHRHESARITKRSCQSRGSPEERTSVEEEARTSQQAKMD